MPLSTTDAAAVEGFLRSRRGTRELRDHVVASTLLTYLLHRVFTATNQRCCRETSSHPSYSCPEIPD